jgi:hypothetical protein
MKQPFSPSGLTHNGIDFKSDNYPLPKNGCKIISKVRYSMDHKCDVCSNKVEAGTFYFIVLHASYIKKYNIAACSEECCNLEIFRSI